MVQTLKRTFTVLRIAGLLLLIGLLITGGITLYEFYAGQVGLTAPRAVEGYFVALATGDNETVYAMTDSQYLKDLYGRPVSQGAFIEQLELMQADQPPTLEGIETNKLFDRDGYHYFEVLITSREGERTQTNRLVAQARHEDGSWLVAFPFAIWP